MPFTGGGSPSPERAGGGENNSSAPMLQRVYESLAGQRGTAYDASWPPTTIVGVETMAFARAIVFDGYLAGQRLANNFLPNRATLATGMLPRWERVFGIIPPATATEPDRRAALVAAWQRVGMQNTLQPIADAITAALGPMFVGIQHQTPLTATMWWPGGTTNPAAPWYSTIYHVLVQVTQDVAGYHNLADGSPNADFYAAIGAIPLIMDALLPSWCTWDWYVESSHGAAEFRLDEHDLDLEVFGP